MPLTNNLKKYFFLSITHYTHTVPCIVALACDICIKLCKISCTHFLSALCMLLKLLAPAVEGILSIERLPYVNSILRAMFTSSVSRVWLHRKTKNLSRSLNPCSEISLISVTISILLKTAKISGKSCQVSQKDFLSFPVTDRVVSHSLIQ